MSTLHDAAEELRRIEAMVAEQFAKVDVHKAANEARIAALNLPVDGDLDFLDRAMERYGEAVEAHRSALCRIEEHDDAQQVAA